MKIVLLLLFIHLFAYSVVKAQETVVVPSAVSSAVLVEANLPQDDKNQIQRDECKDLLPQLETDLREIETKSRNLSESTLSSQENYLNNFNQMTGILFQMVQAREAETAQISASRDRLRSSVEQFDLQRTSANSQNLQSQYLDLTMRLYASLMDGQKSLEILKTQLSQVESTRGLLESTRQEMEALDHQRLAIEGKLISLKIKCQTDRNRY